MLKEAIKEIYLNVINVILNDIDEKYKEEVSNNYLEYLYSMYSDKEINEQNYSKIVEILSKIEYEKWKRRDRKSKLYHLKKDKSFDVINDISKKAYSLASMHFEGKTIDVSKEEIDKNINILVNQLNSVEDFNKEEAERLVSEGILDFGYAIGKNDNVTSLRIGHLLKK